MRAIPDRVELAIVAVPAAQVRDTIVELGDKGIDTAIVFSSGFAEMGEQGERMQADMRDAARAAGVRVCGPNCLGLMNAFDNVMATFSQVGDAPTPPGPVAFVTQSGAFGTAIAARIAMMATTISNSIRVNPNRRCVPRFVVSIELPTPMT